MTRGKKKAAAGAVIVYLLLSCGLWMFVESFSGFCSRISAEEAPETGLVQRISLPLKWESLPLYVLMPDELRSACQLCGLVVEEL